MPNANKDEFYGTVDTLIIFDARMPNNYSRKYWILRRINTSHYVFQFDASFLFIDECPNFVCDHGKIVE